MREQGGQLHIKSVDGFIFFRLSYFGYSDLQLFAIFIFEVDFSETYLMTSTENNVSEPPNLKIFWGTIPRYPSTSLVPSVLAIMPPVTKTTSYGPVIMCQSLTSTSIGPFSNSSLTRSAIR